MSFTLTLPDGTDYTHKQCTDALFIYLLRLHIDPFTGDLDSTFRKDHQFWITRDVRDVVCLSILREEHERGEVRVVLDDMITASGCYAELYAFAGELVDTLAEETR